MLEAELLQEFQPHLLPDEKVIWVGRPTMGWLVTKDYKRFLIILVGFVALSLYNLLKVFLGLVPEVPETSHFGISLWFIFLVTLLIWTIGYPWWDAKLRKSEIYAVTTARLLVVREGECQSSVLCQLPQLRRIDNGNYRDTINFSPLTEDSEGTPDGPQNGSSFRFLQDPEEVFEIIMRAQEEVKRTQNAKPNYTFNYGMDVGGLKF